MNLLNWIGKWFDSLFRTDSDQPQESVTPVLFPEVKVVYAAPRNEQIFLGLLYCVVSAGKPKWSLFRCPCGCGDVITLSLQAAHSPHWRLTNSDSGRPTLYPSIWRDKGCLSHFWLRDGQITWCFDSGSHPSQ